jgi:hypothetical protein
LSSIGSGSGSMRMASLIAYSAAVMAPWNCAPFISM